MCLENTTTTTNINIPMYNSHSSSICVLIQFRSPSNDQRSTIELHIFSITYLFGFNDSCAHIKCFRVGESMSVLAYLRTVPILCDPSFLIWPQTHTKRIRAKQETRNSTTSDLDNSSFVPTNFGKKGSFERKKNRRKRWANFCHYFSQFEVNLELTRV